MYVSFTRVDTTDQPIENATMVAEEMARWLRDVEGFEGFLLLTREGSALGLTFWESRDVAVRHEPARTKFLERMASVAGVLVEERTEFDVAFAELGPALAAFSKDP